MIVPWSRRAPGVPGPGPGLSVGWHLATRRWRLLALTILTLLVSLFYAAFVLLQPIVSPVTFFTWLLLLGVAYNPRVGLYFAFAMVMLFEAGNADKMMEPGAYFHGGLSSTLGLPGLIASPLELLLLLTLGFWITRAAAQRKLDFRGGHLGWTMFAFFVCLVLGLLRGVLGGGDFNIALWESRFLFYMVACYYLASNTIRTPAHLRQLLAVTLVAATVWAVEGVYRRVALIDTGLLGVVPEFAFSHEVVVFLGCLILLVVAQQVFGAPLWQRLFGLAALPVALFTLLATERRAGYISVMVAFLALSLVFLVARRRAFFLIAVPVLLAGAIYLPLFWNNTSMIGQPARAVRSLREPDPRDAASNLYRVLEKINVQATIRSNPLLGGRLRAPFPVRRRPARPLLVALLALRAPPQHPLDLAQDRGPRLYRLLHPHGHRPGPVRVRRAPGAAPRGPRLRPPGPVRDHLQPRLLLRRPRLYLRTDHRPGGDAPGRPGRPRPRHRPPRGSERNERTANATGTAGTA